MTPGSLPPLSPQARALLSAEREILPRPELERRRATLRARTAGWHARQSAELPGARSALAAWWRRGRLAAFGVFGATSAFAAWVALQPTALFDDRAPVVTSAAQHPVAQRVPPAATASGDVGPPSARIAEESNASPREAQTLPEPTPLQTESKPPDVVGNGTPSSFSKRSRSRPVSTNNQDTSSQELALLDRARRALAADDFRAALQVIEKHARSFPNSQLGEEREALRVRALSGAGLSMKAGEAARDFESRFPKSVLTPELQKNDRTTP